MPRLPCTLAADAVVASWPRPLPWHLAGQRERDPGTAGMDTNAAFPAERNPRANLECARHLLREAWRKQLFSQFTQTNRRDARHLRDRQYDESLCKQAGLASK